MYPSYNSSNSSHSEYDNMDNSSSAGGGGRSSTAVHNLYNLHTHRTSRYDSCDELKTPSPSSSTPAAATGEYYDSFTDAGERVPVPAPPAHILAAQQAAAAAAAHQQAGGLDTSHSTSSSSLPLHPQHPGGDLPELTPSRFGSKRESHSDYRDSPYQIVDMPPPPSALHSQYLPPPQPAREQAYQAYQGQDSGGQQQEYGIPSGTPHPSANIPYIDSSQSSLTSSTSSAAVAPQYPYRGPTAAGSADSSPAYTPQYQSDPPAPPHHSNAATPTGVDGSTVTKYQNYVEVSKPFEMADAYKYSERRRKQHQHPASSPSPHQSPYLPRAAHHLSNSRPASPYTDSAASSSSTGFPTPPNNSSQQQRAATFSPRHTPYTPTTPDNNQTPQQHR